MTITEAVAAYVTRLQHLHNEVGFGDTVHTEEGKKYIKVYRSTKWQQIVHSFVNKDTGSLYKAAGWKAPVVEERYNLLTELDLVVRNMDQYGSYLYKDTAAKIREQNS